MSRIASIAQLARPFFQQVRHMPKPGKTSKAARARFTLATDHARAGVLLRSYQGASHLNIKKSSSRRTRLKRDTFVSNADRKRISKLFGRL